MREGEIVASKVRLAIVGLASFVPIGAAILNPRDPEPWIGLLFSGVNLGIGLWFAWLAHRPVPPAWLMLASCLLDVTIVSAVHAGFVLSGQPLAATNGRVAFSVYLIALSLTVLRQDPRLCILSGVEAVIQYLAVVLWAISSGGVLAVSHATYGAFRWENQATRLVLLVLATAINTTIVRQSQRYFAASIYDPLTGLTNRRYAFQRLVEIVGAALRTRRPVTVAIIDLDHFKHINDRFGHAAGDRVLVQFADMLRSSFRASDVLSRYGGEEFLLILPEGDVSGAVSRLENFRIRFAAQRFGGAASGLTLSIGVALFPEDGKTPEVLIGRADERLYQAKNAGRDRVVTPHGGTPVVVRMDGR